MGINLNKRLPVERGIQRGEFLEMVEVVVGQGRRRERKG